MSSQQKMTTRPNLSVLALVSFLASFTIARTFTTLYPNTRLIGGGYHIHHFWFGLAMLVIGGWLGISYQNDRSDRFASVIFGAGGGLVGDEVGLLLTFGEYWTGITYTFIIIVSSVAAVAILFNTYQKTIRNEFDHFLIGHFGFYIGVFLTTVSAAFLIARAWMSTPLPHHCRVPRLDVGTVWSCIGPRTLDSAL
jgi:hypothetical protein